jgi:hypothetical protein
MSQHMENVNHNGRPQAADLDGLSEPLRDAYNQRLYLPSMPASLPAGRAGSRSFGDPFVSTPNSVEPA